MIDYTRMREQPVKTQREILFNTLCGAEKIHAVTTWRHAAQGEATLMYRDEIWSWTGDEPLLLIPAKLKPGAMSTGTDFIHLSNIEIDEITAVSFTVMTKHPTDEGTSLAIALARMGIKNPAIISGKGYVSIVYRLKMNGHPEGVIGDTFKALKTVKKYFPVTENVMPLVPIPCEEKGVVFYSFGNEWSENDPVRIGSITNICSLKEQPSCDWNAHYPLCDITKDEIFKDWKKEQIVDGIVRMSDDEGNLVVFDTLTAKVGMWANDFDRFMTIKCLHPYTKPAPTRIGESIRPQHMLSFKDILKKDLKSPAHDKIPTGIGCIDRLIAGIPAGGLSLISGATGHGKSTLTSQIILNLVEQGYKVSWFHAEQDDVPVFRALVNQAVGVENLSHSEGAKSSMNAPVKLRAKVAEWLDGRVALYNNEHSFMIEEVLDTCKKDCADRGAHVLVIDNLMMLDCRTPLMDENQRQKYKIMMLKKFATNTGVTILLVAHTIKMNGLISTNSILGASEIVKMCDDIICIYKAEDDLMSFKQAYYDKYKEDKKQTAEELFYKKFGTATSIISIIKARYDELPGPVYMPLWYETGSKRFLDFNGQQIQYGWQPRHRPPIYTQSSIPFKDNEIVDKEISEMIREYEKNAAGKEVLKNDN